jgi:hypothetical protein
MEQHPALKLITLAALDHHPRSDRDIPVELDLRDILEPNAELAHVELRLAACSTLYI